MKSILKCRVTIFLLFSWLSLSAVGYIGKDTIYKNYEQNISKTPYFVLVFEGIHDGIYPWNMKNEMVAEQPVEEQPEATGSKEEMQTQGAGQMQEEIQMQVEEDKVATEKVPKEFVNVDESYFSDAVFIGDSRTVGLHDYGGLEDATFYATVGMNIYDLWTDAFCEVEGAKKKVTLEEALSQNQYKKIYFQIGINEMGTGTVDSFMQAYESTVQKLMELQPNAIIYVQGIMHVTKEKSDSDEIFNNLGIQVRNDRIKLLADNEKIFYIDMNEVVCDRQGNLQADLTFDNLHLYASKYDIWVDFLKTKGVEMETS